MKKNIVVFGEVLFDVFPDRKILGGAPFNFAYHLNAFGFPVNFVSKIGKDQNGKEITGYIEKCKMPMTYIQQDDKYPTGVVKVEIKDKGMPSYTIVEDCAYDHTEYVPELDALADSTSFVCFGTLAQRSKSSRETIKTFLNKICGDTQVFLDLNLRAPFYSEELIKDSLKLATILKINDDECSMLKSMFMNSNDSEKDLVKNLNSKFGINTVVITKGDKGSSLYSFENNLEVHKPAIKVTNLCDTIGAGDSFSSMFAASILKGLPYDRAMVNATSFASEFCKFHGAIPESLSFYDKFKSLLV